MSNIASEPATHTEFEDNLQALQRDGFLLIPQVLDPQTIERWNQLLYDLYEKKEYDINNSVGNVAFDRLLGLEPEMSNVLLGHTTTVRVKGLRKAQIDELSKAVSGYRGPFLADLLIKNAP